MTSGKQIAANRRNARRSTGPVTREGKSRSARNAFRHGLSRPISTAGATATEIGNYVDELAGEDASPTESQLATMAVEAQFELARIRQQSRLLLEQVLLGDPRASAEGGKEAQDLNALKRLMRIERYERRAVSRRKKALNGLAGLGRPQSISGGDDRE